MALGLRVCGLDTAAPCNNDNKNNEVKIEHTLENSVSSLTVEAQRGSSCFYVPSFRALL